MIKHSDFENNLVGKLKLQRLIHQGKIAFGGNIKLKIFGQLSCSSGKRMKRSNRIFFESKNEAIELGYRPCAHCMRKEYVAWLTNASGHPYQ